MKQYDKAVYITREMINILNNEKASCEKRLRILLAIINNRNTENEDWDFTVESLREGFNWVNKKIRRQEDAHRESSRNYQKELRKLAKTVKLKNVKNDTVDDNCKQFRTIQVQTSTNKNNIPLNPPPGIEEKIPEAISAEELICETETADVRETASELADEIEETEAWNHMMVNRGKLMRCLVSTLKKNSAAVDEIISGIEKWTEFWKRDDWRYAPGKITDWLYDGKWKQEPRKKEAAEVGSGCGECGVFVG